MTPDATSQPAATAPALTRTDVAQRSGADPAFMVEGAQQAGLPPAHVGPPAGPVLFQEGDCLGRTATAASRIADFARRGEVLVTDEVVGATKVRGVEFEIGPVELKGLSRRSRCTWRAAPAGSRARRARIPRPWLGSSVVEQAAHNR